jgi:radical SAM protein with 4Fe4S-binding SPASM domain
MLCDFPWKNLIVDNEGNVYNCAYQRKERPLGNLKEQTIEQIWNSYELKLIRKRLLEGKFPEICMGKLICDARRKKNE